MPNLVWTPSSMREAITDLTIGDSYARTKRLPLKGISKNELTKEVAAIRNTLNTAMRRAMEETGHHYTLETGTVITHNGALLLVAAVTRTE